MASWLSRVLSRPQGGTSTVYSSVRRHASWTRPPAPTPPPPPPPALPRWWKTKLLICIAGLSMQVGAARHYGKIHGEWLAEFVVDSWLSMEIVKERPERFGGHPLSYWVAVRDRKEIVERELQERYLVVINKFAITKTLPGLDLGLTQQTSWSNSSDNLSKMYQLLLPPPPPLKKRSHIFLRDIVELSWILDVFSHIFSKSFCTLFLEFSSEIFFNCRGYIRQAEELYERFYGPLAKEESEEHERPEICMLFCFFLFFFSYVLHCLVFCAFLLCGGEGLTLIIALLSS